MNDGKKRRSSAELPAHKRFEKSDVYKRQLLRFQIVFIKQRRGKKAAQVDLQSLTKLVDDPQLHRRGPAGTSFLSPLHGK